jgi:hypothetical protein
MATRAILLPNSAEFPSTNFPQLTIINATDRRPVLGYDATTNEKAYWSFIAPAGLTGTITLVLHLLAASAVSGNIIMQSGIEAITPSDASPTPQSASSFDTVNASAATAVPGTLIMFSISITMTNADSIAAGDLVRLYIERNAASASDTAAGDIYLVAAEFKDAA